MRVTVIKCSYQKYIQWKQKNPVLKGWGKRDYMMIISLK